MTSRQRDFPSGSSRFRDGIVGDPAVGSRSIRIESRRGATF